MLGIMIRIDHLPLTWLPMHVNTDLKIFGRENLWNEIFTKSFSTWFFRKQREEAWVAKYSSSRAVELYKMWIERYSMCYESTFSIIRIEDCETVKNNVRCVFNSNNILTQVDTITSEILLAFSYEQYKVAQDHESSTKLIYHALRSAINFLPE